MDNEAKIRSALDSIDPSSLDYEEWIHVGMALKAEGFPASVWDDWSSRDVGRYHFGECEKKFDTFQDSGITAGTIIDMARSRGWKYDRALSWDDGLLASYEETLAAQETGNKPYQMTVKYLEAMFDPSEVIGYVHSAMEKEGKWIPANGGIYRPVQDIIKDLKKYRTLDSAFGTINPEAGAWIRINPTTGPKDKDVTRLDYVLIESDSLPIEEQKKFLISSELPIVALVESGGKSVHAVVRVDAKTKQEYDQRVAFLFDWLGKNNFIVDKANKNPSRLSRLPGAERHGNIQKLIATKIGRKSWLDWIDFIEGVDDDLPPLGNFWEQYNNPPSLTPELIASILREGNKMIITGDSKSGKTCLSQELAVCLAEGKPWLDKFQCEQGRVLYMNFEVQEASLFERFKRIYAEHGWKITQKGASNIIPWDLRGKAIPLDKLASKVIRRCRNEGPFVAIIIDPLYKVQQGDENSAEAITTFCNAIDKIAQETGAAVIYDHHHPKGAMGERKAMDRGSGSGVFARDADAIIDLSSLSPDAEAKERLGKKLAEGEKPMLMSFILRDFKDIEPLPIWFKFPVHYIASNKELEGVPIEGSREDNMNKSGKRGFTKSDHKMIVDEAFAYCENERGKAPLKGMSKYAPVTEKSLRNWINDELSDFYEIENGSVKRKN